MNLLVPGGYSHPDAQTEGERRSNADEREHPHDGQRNQRRSDTRHDGSDRTPRGVHIPKPAGHEILRLRETDDHRRRRQCKCEQCKHEYPLVTFPRWTTLGALRRPPDTGFALASPAVCSGTPRLDPSSIHPMRAAVITRFGGPEVLEIRDVEAPVIDDDQLLVRVRASGLNRADIHQRNGGYPAPPGSPADIPGLEYAGEVVELGKDVRDFAIGDRVFGIAGGGAHAELIAVHARTAARAPSRLSWTDAGAVPEAFITAHDALVTQAHLTRGERVLIHAVGSGVGLAAVQVARAVGAIPFGTSRTADKINRALPYGLERGGELRDAKALSELARNWAPGGFDVVLDLVGGAYTPASIDLLATRGRLMLVGLVAGATATFDLRRVLSRRVSVIGTVLRARSVDEKAAATAAFIRDLGGLFERGSLRPVVDREFSLDRIADAHRRMESNESFGKVLIVP